MEANGRQALTMRLHPDALYDAPYQDLHVEVEAPLYEMSGLPVFVRAGAILCRQDLVPHLDDCPPRRLLLDVYLFGRSECELHESANVTHRFVSEDRRSTVRVTLENRFDFPRKYVVRLAGESGVLDVDMAPGSTKQVELARRG